jgi:hypothetical protein
MRNLIQRITVQVIGYFEVIVTFLFYIKRMLHLSKEVQANNKETFRHFLATKTIRTFAYSFLAIYLKLIGFTDLYIGFDVIIWSNIFVTSSYNVIGTINVTGTENGSFLSIEQAIPSQTINYTKKRCGAICYHFLQKSQNDSIAFS